MFVEDGFGNRLLGKRLPRLGGGGIFWLVEIHVEAKDVPILNRVGDGVGVELFLEQVLCGSQGGCIFLDLSGGRVALEDRGASEAEEL